MTTEHTPTPWYTSNAGTSVDYYPKDNNCSPVSIADLHYLNGMATANAAFLVRAVNAHDTLVKALEDALRDIAGRAGYDTLAQAEATSWFSSAYAKHFAALRLAKGEPSFNLVIVPMNEPNGEGHGWEKCREEKATSWCICIDGDIYNTVEGFDSRAEAESYIAKGSQS